MTRREFDMSHCKKAYELRLQWLSFKKVGAKIGVSEQRASEMFITYKHHLELEEAKADLAEWRHSLYA